MKCWLAVFLFELKRILTPGRACWWLVVAAFPVMITLLMTISLRPPRRADQQTIDWIYTIAIYYLAPSISCMLGALLTAAPVVASELEQHSWVYFATRPHGLRHLLLGKYLVAVLWSASATIVGVSIAVPVSKIVAKQEVWLALTALSLASATAYSAMYVMIGSLFHSRAIVFCVAYTAGIEIFLGSFPALVNRLTLQYRLRSLLFLWTTPPERFRTSNVRELVASAEPGWVQLAWLAFFTLLFLAVGLFTVRVREFTAAVESDV